MRIQPRNPTIYLFDIDGTLITSGGTGRGAMLEAFEQVLDMPSVKLSFSFGGMTDRAIVRQGLTELDVPVDESRIDALLALYLERLECTALPGRGFREHVGVRPILDSLVGSPNVALGIGTGNVEKGARIKLRCVDLDHYFRFGGFGCDAEARHRLLSRGADRGAGQLGLPREQCRIVVIGDTPRDIEAAHAIGADCIAVATGGAASAELASHNPEWLFDDLTAPGVVQALLGD